MQKLVGDLTLESAGLPDARPTLERKPNLVWIASYPKSGSTWMRLFLHAYLTDGTVDINEKHTWGDMNSKFYEAVTPRPIEQLGPCETFWLRTASLFHIANIPHDQLVKTHCCFGRCMGIDLIPCELTKGAIYIVRDPRDVVVSYAKHSNISIGDTISLLCQPDAFTWKHNIYQYMSDWSTHVESWTSTVFKIDRPFPVLVVRYEDMVNDTLNTFRHVAVAMKTVVDEEKLEKSVFSTRFDNLVHQEEEKGFTEKPEQSKDKFFRQGKVGGWKEILTSAQVRRIETAHGSMMKRLSYL